MVPRGSPRGEGGPLKLLQKRLRRRCDVCLPRVDERNRRLIRVPVTAIWSRADGIVDWRACIDPHDRDIDHVEVRATHLSLGFDPHVLRIVANRLGTQNR
ncbi:MAG: hypothetical protein HOP13_03040 [Alphaproteobacteria bacterium]|nr:hypothetical protein [Alphaproteobacteria bacterium]